MPPERLTAVVAGVTRGPLAGAMVGALERLAPWRRGVVAILTYHRIEVPGAREDLLPGLVSATPEAFEAQMGALVRRYRPVSLAEVIDARADPRRLPPGAVLVTFDDAYADFDAHAWPVLRAAGIPVTLFVPTAYPDRPGAGFWWDRLWAAVRSSPLPEVPEAPGGPLPLLTTHQRAVAMAVLRDDVKARTHDDAMARVEALVARLTPPGSTSPPGADVDRPPTVLGWGRLRQLAAAGVTLAPHTRTHPLLDRIPLAAAVAEIAGSREDLEREIGPTLAVLAYPSGQHGGEAVEAARRAGMVLAVTTNRGGNDLRHADPLRLRRINVGGRAHAALVRGQLVWASTLDARRR